MTDSTEWVCAVAFHDAKNFLDILHKIMKLALGATADVTVWGICQYSDYKVTVKGVGNARCE